MYNDLKGGTGVVTGAGNRLGIGYAVAEKLASCGANVVLADVGAVMEEMQSLAGELAKKYGVQTLAVPVDVSDSASVAALAQAVKDRFGSVRVLVNNAAVNLGTGKTLAHTDEGAWIKTIDINLHGPFRVSRALLPLMKKPAAIINMASRGGKSPAPTLNAYSPSKAGLIMFTKQMALELAPEGIRVNAVCPGTVRSWRVDDRVRWEAEASHISPQEAERVLAAKIPMGRFAELAEVANVTVALASAEFSFVTGVALSVDGGQTMEL